MLIQHPAQCLAESVPWNGYFSFLFPQCVLVLFPFLYMGCKLHTVRGTRLRRWEGGGDILCALTVAECVEETVIEPGLSINSKSCHVRCVLLTPKVPWRPRVAWIADIGTIRIVQLSTKLLAHSLRFCTDSEHCTHSI